MRPTFMGFEAAKRGLASNQKAMDITGHNLTNVNTPGYSRQRADMVSVSSASGANRFALRQNVLAGQGSQVKGIGQIRDPFLDRRFRDEFCDVGYYGKTTEILGDIEAALDEITSEGMFGALDSFRGALKTLMESGDQVTSANMVLTAAKGIGLVLNQYDTKLNQILEQQVYDLNVAVNHVNSTLQQLAGLNKTISEDVFLKGSEDSSVYGSNELLDQRNLLLDDLSNYGNIRIWELEDGGVKVEMNGHEILNGPRWERLEMNQRADQTVNLHWQSTGSVIQLQSGILKGAVDMINGGGPAGNRGIASSIKGIPYYLDKIDQLAVNLAEVFNHVFEENNTSGHLSFKKLFVSNDGSALKAGNISVNPVWNQNPGYLLDHLKRDGEMDNELVAKALTLLDQTYSFGDFQGTFNEYISFYNLSVGEDKAFHEGRFQATAQISDDMLNRRDAISGVSIDEEGVNLLLYDKAYKAVSRLMTTLDEALETLIKSTGLVGR